MTRFRILLLGTPEVQEEGQSIQISRRTNRGLLFYLASTGQPVSRNDLLALFWPEHNEQDARSRLREVLSRLGKAIPGMLETDQIKVGLNFDNLFVDQLEFESRLKKAGNLPWSIPNEEPLPPSTYQLLLEAINLWRGPRFLTGDVLPSTIELDNWHTMSAQRLEFQYSRILERLSGHAKVVGKPDLCMDLTRRALLLDPLNEEYHKNLLECMLAMQLWREGIEHFEYIESLFEKENMLPLSPELRTLHDRLKFENRESISLDTQPVWKLRSKYISPFVGRRQSLHELQIAYSRGGGIVILGESGLGKTRLVQEFSNHIQPKPRILLATCSNSETILPYQPLISLLRDVVQPEDWENMAPTWTLQLSILLPELREYLPESYHQEMLLTSDISPSESRPRFMEAFRHIMLILARDRNLLFCLDDAQWADEATLMTTAYLIERPPFDKNLVVITARREEENPHLDSMLSWLPNSHKFQIVHLPYLDRQEISELVTYISGRIANAALIEQLTQETGGNPLFLLEVLRAFQENNVDLDSIMSNVPISRSLRTLIANRLRNLTSLSNETLQTAAVIGLEFTPDTIAEANRCSLQNVIHALEDLTENQLVFALPRSPKELKYSFIHSMIRDVILQDLNPLRKKELHQKIANYLEKQYSPVPENQAAILAIHFENALDANKAYYYWLRAGQYARQLFSPTEAANAFSQAENLIDYVPDLPTSLVYDLFTEWAEMAYENDDQETIDRLANRLWLLSEKQNSTEFKAIALNLRCQSCMIVNEYETGLDYANQAIQFLTQSQHTAACMEAHLHRGIFLYMLNQLSTAEQALLDALKLGENASNRAELRARANAHYQISFVHSIKGQPKSGIHHGFLSLQDSVQIKRLYGQVMAYNALTMHYYELGDYSQARHFSQLGLDLAERTNASRMLGYLHSFRSMIDLITGNLDKTLYHAEKAIEIGEKYQHPEIISLGYRVLGDLFSWLGDNATGLDYYNKALDETNQGLMAIEPIYRIGLPLYRLGDKEQGKDKIQQGLTITQMTGMDYLYSMAQSCQAILFIYEGQWSETIALATALQRDSFQKGLTAIRLSATLSLGQAYLYTNEIDKAAVQFMSVAEEATRLPLVWIAISAWIFLAITMQRLDSPDASIRLRVEVLLDQMRNQAKSPLIQPAFENYLQEKLKLIP